MFFRATGGKQIVKQALHNVKDVLHERGSYQPITGSIVWNHVGAGLLMQSMRSIAHHDLPLPTMLFNRSEAKPNAPYIRAIRGSISTGVKPAPPACAASPSPARRHRRRAESAPPQ